VHARERIVARASHALPAHERDLRAELVALGAADEVATGLGGAEVVDAEGPSVAIAASSGRLQKTASPDA
jgi:hypothetical protein